MAHDPNATPVTSQQIPLLYCRGAIAQIITERTLRANVESHFTRFIRSCSLLHLQPRNANRRPPSLRLCLSLFRPKGSSKLRLWRCATMFRPDLKYPSRSWITSDLVRNSSSLTHYFAVPCTPATSRRMLITFAPWNACEISCVETVRNAVTQSPIDRRYRDSTNARRIRS